MNATEDTERNRLPYAVIGAAMDGFARVSLRPRRPENLCHREHREALNQSKIHSPLCPRSSRWPNPIMKSIMMTYPGFQTLPRGLKRLLLASENIYFAETRLPAEVRMAERFEAGPPDLWKPVPDMQQLIQASHHPVVCELTPRKHGRGSSPISRN